MKPCCEKYVQRSQPKQAQETDFFFEAHQCPVCRKSLRVQFQRIEVLGGSVEYVAISAEAI